MTDKEAKDEYDKALEKLHNDIKSGNTSEYIIIDGKELVEGVKRCFYEDLGLPTE